MKICVIPLDIVHANPEENIITAAHALSKVEPDTDLVVLPELFTTGYVAEKSAALRLAEPDSGKTVDTVRRWAQFFGFAIVGSYLSTDGQGECLNRAFFIEPGGDATFYNKRHLFPLSDEDKTYSAGTELSPVVRFRGWNFKLIVCFDVRFPVWCRNVPGQLYDVLLVPANWPHSRASQFKLLLAARAVENQAYAVGANCTGHDQYGEYPSGDSAIYDNLGEDIRETRRNGLLYALLDKQVLEDGRRRFPAWKASDKWTIQL